MGVLFLACVIQEEIWMHLICLLSIYCGIGFRTPNKNLQTAYKSLLTSWTSTLKIPYGSESRFKSWLKSRLVLLLEGCLKCLSHRCVICLETYICDLNDPHWANCATQGRLVLSYLQRGLFADLSGYRWNKRILTQEHQSLKSLKSWMCRNGSDTTGSENRVWRSWSVSGFPNGYREYSQAQGCRADWDCHLRLILLCRPGNWFRLERLTMIRTLSSCTRP